MNLEYWKEKWAEAQQNSSLSPGYKRADNWEEFWNKYADRYARENREQFSFYSNIVEYLAMEKIIRSQSKVLDIGCGPGSFSIPMALKGALVTGLDTAAGMLKIMEKEAEIYEIANCLKTISGDWDSFPDESVYDLVLGANTPAIKDYDSLMKMNQVSRRYCCLISFAGSYQSSLRQGIWLHIMGTPLKSQAFDIPFPFNVLYLAGFQPNIRFFPYNWKSTWSIEEMVDHYSAYFKVFGKQGKQIERNVRLYLEKKSEKDFVTDTRKGSVAVIWWQSQANAIE